MFRFLTFEEVLAIHGESLRLFRGRPGIRDRGLIESAMGAAQNVFYYGRGDVFDVAASYAFHLAQAQAFIDGNKRVGIGSAIVFLHLNNVSRIPDAGLLSALYDAMIGMANHTLDKPGLAALMRHLYAG